MARADLLIYVDRAGPRATRSSFGARWKPQSPRSASTVPLAFSFLELRPQRRLADLFRHRLLLVGPPGNGTVFPYPPSLSGKQGWRSLAITLGWFSPIHTLSERWRRADLWFKSADSKLKVGSKGQLERSGADWHAVQRGTPQHEVFEGEAVSAFVDGDAIIVHVSCCEDAGLLRENRSLCIGDYPRGRSSHWGDLP